MSHWWNDPELAGAVDVSRWEWVILAIVVIALVVFGVR